MDQALVVVLCIIFGAAIIWILAEGGACGRRGGRRRRSSRSRRDCSPRRGKKNCDDRRNNCNDRQDSCKPRDGRDGRDGCAGASIFVAKTATSGGPTVTNLSSPPGNTGGALIGPQRLFIAGDLYVDNSGVASATAGAVYVYNAPGAALDTWTPDGSFNYTSPSSAAIQQTSFSNGVQTVVGAMAGGVYTATSGPTINTAASPMVANTEYLVSVTGTPGASPYANAFPVYLPVTGAVGNVIRVIGTNIGTSTNGTGLKVIPQVTGQLLTNVGTVSTTGTSTSSIGLADVTNNFPVIEMVCTTANVGTTPSFWTVAYMTAPTAWVNA